MAEITPIQFRAIADLVTRRVDERFARDASVEDSISLAQGTAAAAFCAAQAFIQFNAALRSGDLPGPVQTVASPEAALRGRAKATPAAISRRFRRAERAPTP